VTAAVATWVLIMQTTPARADTAATRIEARSPGPAAGTDVSAPPARVEPATAAAATSTDAPLTPATPAPAPSADVAPTTSSIAGPSLETTSGGAPQAAAPSSTSAAPPSAATAKAALAAPTAPTPATPPRESAKDKKARESREREARENEARVAAAARLVAPATGTVRIAISPWGLVEVDGASSGAAPPITELTLAEGRHQIVVRNGDYAPHTVSINVTAGQTISVRHKFGS
jgi:serine/threonine-protein kinase